MSCESQKKVAHNDDVNMFSRHDFYGHAAPEVPASEQVRASKGYHTSGLPLLGLRKPTKDIASARLCEPPLRPEHQDFKSSEGGLRMMRRTISASRP